MTMKDATFTNVLDRGAAKHAPANGRTSQPHPNLDWDSVNGDLEGAVRYGTNIKALNALGNTNTAGTFGDTATGLAALIGALQAGKGDSGSDAAMSLVKYVQERDQASIQRELDEIKRTLNTPGSDSTLETISMLQSLGMFEKQDQWNDLIKMKELGLVQIGQPAGAQAPVVTQPSLMDTVKQHLEIMALLRPQVQTPPTSMIQFGDGQAITLPEFLMWEKFKDEKEQRRMDAENSKANAESTRKLLAQGVAALMEAAKVIESNGRTAESPPDAVREPRRPPAEVEEREMQEEYSSTNVLLQEVQVTCDFCQAESIVDVSDEPEAYVCGSCNREVTIEYTKEPV